MIEGLISLIIYKRTKPFIQPQPHNIHYVVEAV